MQTRGDSLKMESGGTAAKADSGGARALVEAYDDLYDSEVALSPAMVVAARDEQRVALGSVRRS